jgi:phosphate/phosphite/phosphonate ABC transporter binding protein
MRTPPVLKRPRSCPSTLHQTALLDLALVLALALGLGTSAAQAGQVVRFAPLPLEDPRIVHEQFRGLVDFLQEQTGMEIRWVPLNDNAEIVRQFREGAIDLAYLGPLPYVMLARDDPAARALSCFRDADGETAYTCSLVANADSGLSLERLKGVRFGLTQPYSTCGYLASSQMLAAAGLTLTGDGNSFSYAGSHSAAALGVVQGKYDVAGVKTSIAGRYRHLGLDVIATSPSYPGFTLVANAATLDGPTIDRLQETVLRLDTARHPELAGRMRTWGEQIRNGTVPHSRCDFAGVAAALANLPWPIPEASP